MATEKRLMCYDPITLESFTRHITKHREPYDHYDMGYVDAVDQIEDWLDANTVDAVEVVHGRWIDIYDGLYANAVFKCSICGNDAPIQERYPVIGRAYTTWEFTPYCPNCGARMDGDHNERL